MICQNCIHSEVCKHKMEAVYECEHFKDGTIKNQYDRIRNMSIEELASFICGVYDYEYDSPVYNETENGKHICGDFIPDYDEDSIKRYLESEVDTE